MKTSIRRALRAASAAVLWLAAGAAHAICFGPANPSVLVGDTASDASCNYNDLQSAIDAAGTDPACYSIIHVTKEHTYTQQHLTISNRRVAMVGWGDGVTCADIRAACTFTDCPMPAPAINPLVIISGHNGDSVIHIDGASDVSLLNLTISGGTVASNQKGGGIYYDGTGSLTLASTTVNLNHAGYGAGINFAADGGPANLYLNAYTEVLVNSADVDGGGIRVEGGARLFALQPRTLIAFNHAPNGYGGGVDVVGASADFGSGGYGGLPVVYNNTALHGGGVAVVEDDNAGASKVRAFTTDAHNPVAIGDNSASATGGAFYVGGVHNYSTLCLFDFRIDNNTAPEGAAIYANHLSQTGLNMEADPPFPNCTTPETPPQLGAVACAPDAPCNEINDNVAEDGGGNHTDGAVIRLEDESNVDADRLRMQGNQAGRAFALNSGDFTTLIRLSNCLLTDNAFGHELVAGFAGLVASVSLNSCTIANNTIGAPYVMLARDSFTLTNSIVDQPGRATVDYTGGQNGFTVDYVLANDTTTLPVKPGIVAGAPLFADAANRDYHQRRASLGVDFAPAAGGLDLDRKSRTFDIAAEADLYGPMDVGAYELHLCAADTFFCDGFEAQ